MNAAFYTLGCKLNQSETESIAASFREAGVSVVDFENEASVYVVNTCTVTSKGEQKARRVIRKILSEKPDSCVIITGCYAQLGGEELAALGDRVIVVPLDRKDVLLDLPARLSRQESGCGGYSDIRDLVHELSGRPPEAHDRFRFRPVPDGFHTRPSLKIQDGCNNGCSYCRVPIARGPSVSLEPDEVVRRILSLERNGTAEVVLTGVNISSWEHGIRFPDLLDRILRETGSMRIRLSSLEPEVIDNRLADVLSHTRICPHFHLPVQSGSDRVLGAMKRRYRAAKITEVVSFLRHVKEDPFFAADVITGFPGESAEDSGETARLLEKLDFAWLHVFPFSPRPGTVAAGMPDRVPEVVSTARASELQTLSRALHARYAERQIGRRLRMVPETEIVLDGNPFWQGMTENYLKVTLPASSSRPIRKGVPVECRIDRIRDSFLCASVVTL